MQMPQMLDKNTNIALVTAEMIVRRKLNTSAAEILVLFINFGFMVGSRRCTRMVSLLTVASNNIIGATKNCS